MFMIKGVILKQLKPIPDERGMVMEILRSDDPEFRSFGQVYLSTIYPGVVKGWHFHKAQTDHIAIIKGMVKFVLYDNRPGSGTKGELMELFIGEQNPVLVTVPAEVLHGMKGVGVEPAYMVNCPTEPYNHAQPDEFRRAPDDPSIPYDWGRKDG
jgi:dTDP-4-dehydrorhamnose 3,5-epimerase